MRQRKVSIHGVFAAIQAERKRQGEKWGSEHDSQHTFSDWLDILYAELFEAISASGPREHISEAAKTEILHVAAVAVAALEWRGLPEETLQPDGTIVAVGHEPEEEGA